MRRSARRKIMGATTRSALAGQLAWQQPTYVDPPVCVLSDEQIEAFHPLSPYVIEKIVIRFLNEEALDILETTGCDVDHITQNVEMDSYWVAEQVALAPAQFAVSPRNPKRFITISGIHFCFGQVASPPNVMDLDNVRRPGTRDDYQRLIKLTQSYNFLHTICGYPAEPLDLHASICHLHCIYDALTLSHNIIHVYSLGEEQVEDGMEMTRISSGLLVEEFYKTPWLFNNINSSFSMQNVTFGHSNLIYHSAGWLVGGLSASFEKFVIDCEMLQRIIYTQQPGFETDIDLAVNAIEEVEPDGNVFGTEHTQTRYKDAFYSPLLSDWSNCEA